jgi:hypothetical protein
LTQRPPTPLPSPKGAERRATPRFSCTRGVFFQFLTGRGEDLWRKARIADVSVGGIGLVTSASLPAGSRVAVDLNEAHERLSRRAVARVVHARPLSAGVLLGCAWLGPLDDDELRLLREPI